AQAAASPAAAPMERADREAAAQNCKTLLEQLNARLATRKSFSLPGLIYVADLSAELGQTDAARALYQAVLSRAEQDPAFAQANLAALTRIQARLVGLLRQQGQFAEGLAQVEKLIAQHPNALEPKMEKGRVLQSWAEVEPARLAEAVAHWSA